MQESLAENVHHVADGDGLFTEYLPDGVVWRKPRGIPGGEYHYGFTTFCVMLVVLIGGVAWWLHRSKWL